MMQQTSLIAYQNLQPKLNRREQEVLEALEYLKMATDKELSNVLEWSINRVTGRRNALVKKGVVRSIGKRPDGYTHNLANVWSTSK